MLQANLFLSPVGERRSRAGHVCTDSQALALLHPIKAISNQDWFIYLFRQSQSVDNMIYGIIYSVLDQKPYYWNILNIYMHQISPSPPPLSMMTFFFFSSWSLTTAVHFTHPSSPHHFHKLTIHHQHSSTCVQVSPPGVWPVSSQTPACSPVRGSWPPAG